MMKAAVSPSVAKMRSGWAPLWEYLDVVDPKPQLKLVKLPLPAVDRRHSTVELFDPYDDPIRGAFQRPSLL